MKYTLLITAHPLSAGAHTAYEFAAALLNKNHSIETAFFFQEGVLTGGLHALSPQDERPIYTLWKQLCFDKKLTLTCCSTSMQRRGILLSAHFKVGGLGQLMGSIQASDRFIQFHA